MPEANTTLQRRIVSLERALRVHIRLLADQERMLLRYRTALEDIANNPPGSSWRLIGIASKALEDEEAKVT